MQVRIEEVSPVEKKLIVEVPWDTVSSRLQHAYKELARDVQLKGFRKGKVPQAVLQRMFGKRVSAEVAYQLVQESFVNAAVEHKIEAVSEPIVEQELAIKKGEPFAFEAIVQVRGEVVAQDFEGMELNKRPLKVGDEAVDAAIESLRKEHTELRPIEGRDLSARTDILSIKLVGTVGEHELNRESMPVDLDDPASEPLPGLIEALTGIPLDATDHEITLTIPEDFHEKSIAGVSSTLTVSVLDARRKEVPELDDDFAKDTGRGETVDELRAAVRTQLEESQASEIQRELRDAALIELVKRNQIPVAPALVDRAVELQITRFRSMLGIPKGRGSDEEFGLTGELRDKMRPRAVDEVRGQLLLEAIADKEEISVTDEDIDAHLLEVASARSVPLARLRAEYDRDGRLDNLRFSLRQEKVLDRLIASAVVTEKEPEPAPEPGPDEASSDEGASATVTDE